MNERYLVLTRKKKAIVRTDSEQLATQFANLCNGEVVDRWKSLSPSTQSS